MEIQIPSPSVFLKPSPTVTTAVISEPKKSVKPRGTAKKKVNQDAAVAKPKQSKSRNGCMTCKKKRLKCDETKPTCVQCHKRNVPCEGYKKDYKWRTFEETTYNSKVAAKKRKDFGDGNWMPTFVSTGDPSTASSSSVNENIDIPISRIVSPSTTEVVDELEIPIDLPDLDFIDRKSASPPPPSANTLRAPLEVPGEYGSSSASFSSESPRFSDMLIPTPDLERTPSADQNASHLDDPFQHDAMADSNMEDVDEEIVRDMSGNGATSWRRQSSFPNSNRSELSRSPDYSIPASPDFDMSSPEMLMLRFDKQTCGILSVKDGPTENPWRTLLWPLAGTSEALYHAICAMTAFHGAYEVPKLRVAGMAHMTKSIRKLAADIENMRLDSALATSLALALSEGWDVKISTGIQHLAGAKIMVNNAIVKHRKDLEKGQLSPQDAVRLKFLCNTFIYSDVIARLTSIEEAQDLNLEDIIMAVNQPIGDLVEIDPLMGCATTLFPLIGRVANLIQKVRKTEKNSLAIVSQAMELKQLLTQWQTPSGFIFERPEDPSSEVQHSIQTAEAYRYATLLYLHQAVPEIPADSAEVLAKRVLMLLASVPLSSRTLIVQIFPLFTASCEVSSQDDRNWVIQRWQAMSQRLKIGNVDSSWSVVQEVWRRRDAFESEKAHRLMRRYTSRGLSSGEIHMAMPSPIPTLSRRSTAEIPFDEVDLDYTVRGRLHWVGVMTDWKWEVFLG